MFLTDGVPMKPFLIRSLISIVLLFAFIISPAAGDIYTWTDENGVKHFSNEPPVQAEQVEQQAEIKHDAAQYQQWEQQRKAHLKDALENKDAVDDAKKATSKATKTTPDEVVIYTTPMCGYCKRAKAFFTAHQIAYTEYDITADPQAKKRFQELNGNGVPLIFIGKERVIGFNRTRLKKLLGIES